MSFLLNQTETSDATFFRRSITDLSRQTVVPFLSFFKTQAFKAEMDASSLKIPKFERWMICVSDKLLCKAWGNVTGRMEKRSNCLATTSNLGAVEHGALVSFPCSRSDKIQAELLGLHRLTNSEGLVGGMSNNVYIHQSCSLTYINAWFSRQFLISKGSTGRKGDLVLRSLASFQTSNLLHSRFFL